MWSKTGLNYLCKCKAPMQSNFTPTLYYLSTVNTMNRFFATQGKDFIPNDNNNNKNYKSNGSNNVGMETKTDNENERENNNNNSSNRDESKHVQIHAYRSLVTLSKEPVNLNKLNLSFSERKALQYGKTQDNRLNLNETININDNNNNNNSKSLMKAAPAIAYEIWHSPPEVYDRVYGFESDCEPPDRHNIQWKWLYKAWGYYSDREVRYRCGLYCYMKAQRRCARQEFWDVFDLENTFRVELQLLCLHLWFAKTRMAKFAEPKGHKLGFKTFKTMFEQLPNRFGKHMSGMKSRWINDCQQACLHFCVSLDHALEDYSMDKDSFAKVIWNELYLSNRDMEHDLLYLWTDYIMQEIESIGQTSEYDFLNGWWKFGPIPTMDDRINLRQKIINEYQLDQDEQTKLMKNFQSRIDKNKHKNHDDTNSLKKNEFNNNLNNDNNDKTVKPQ